MTVPDRGPMRGRLRDVADRFPRALALARTGRQVLRWARGGGRPLGWIRFGDLRRLAPFDRNYGYGRGRPVDRYYIENFLASHAADIRGRILEVGDPDYTRMYGTSVSHLDVLDVAPGNPDATLVADLTDASHISSGTYDCVIAAETLQLIYDLRAALRTLERILRPGGVLLATFPGIRQFPRHDAAAWSYYWALTTRSARRLFEEAFPGADVQIQAFGNVLATCAQLYGLANQDLRVAELDFHDPDYELVIAARVAKRPDPG